MISREGGHDLKLLTWGRAEGGRMTRSSKANNPLTSSTRRFLRASVGLFCSRIWSWSGNRRGLKRENEARNEEGGGGEYIFPFPPSLVFNSLGRFLISSQASPEFESKMALTYTRPKCARSAKIRLHCRLSHFKILNTSCHSDLICILLNLFFSR